MLLEGKIAITGLAVRSKRVALGLNVSDGRTGRVDS